MADNYLGRKMEEYFTRPNRRDTRRPARTLEQLLLKTAATAATTPVSSCAKTSCGASSPSTRSPPRPATSRCCVSGPCMADEAPTVTEHIRLGGALPELHLPAPGTEPNAYIICCSTIAEDRYVDMDLGISAQSMLLRATEMGLNGICIRAFDRMRIREIFSLDCEPLLILAIGRGTDRIELVDIRSQDDRRYYRVDGVHYVPKLTVDDLIIE